METLKLPTASACLLVAALMALTIWWWRGRSMEQVIPAELRGGIPETCRQLVVVRAARMDGPGAVVWLLEREAAGNPWKAAAGPLGAVVGRRGAGWGKGEPELPNPGKYPDKKEGDGKSPAGLFPLPFAFGPEAQPSAAIRLPWRECTPALRGVDDGKSRYYNELVDESLVPDKDWVSAEIMRREDGLYDPGVMIGHNAARIPGAGSCIFLHVWQGPGKGTAGCTAMARRDVRKILTWLDPAGNPRLALGAR